MAVRRNETFSHQSRRHSTDEIRLSCALCRFLAVAKLSEVCSPILGLVFTITTRPLLDNGFYVPAHPLTLGS